ncbi:MAG: holin, BlyA family protein [Lachnospiraceae bacterium]|nr:holin, BlyA family protein [Lachnospiraceae bacterium]
MAGSRLIDRARSFWKDEDGMGTVEIILIIVVLIGLVIVFKQQINGIVESVFQTITKEKNAVTGG